MPDKRKIIKAFGEVSHALLDAQKNIVRGIGSAAEDDSGEENESVVHEVGAKPIQSSKLEVDESSAAMADLEQRDMVHAPVDEYRDLASFVGISTVSLRKNNVIPSQCTVQVHREYPVTYKGLNISGHIPLLDRRWRRCDISMLQQAISSECGGGTYKIVIIDQNGRELGSKTYCVSGEPKVSIPENEEEHKQHRNVDDKERIKRAIKRRILIQRQREEINELKRMIAEMSERKETSRIDDQIKQLNDAINAMRSEISRKEPSEYERKLDALIEAIKDSKKADGAHEQQQAFASIMQAIISNTAEQMKSLRESTMEAIRSMREQDDRVKDLLVSLVSERRESDSDFRSQLVDFIGLGMQMAQGKIPDGEDKRSTIDSLVDALVPVIARVLSDNGISKLNELPAPPAEIARVESSSSAVSTNDALKENKKLEYERIAREAIRKYKMERDRIAKGRESATKSPSSEEINVKKDTEEIPSIATEPPSSARKFDCIVEAMLRDISANKSPAESESVKMIMSDDSMKSLFMAMISGKLSGNDMASMRNDISHGNMLKLIQAIGSKEGSEWIRSASRYVATRIQVEQKEDREDESDE